MFVSSRLPAPHLLRTALALLLGLPIASAHAGNFTWDNTTGNWTDAARWGGVAPTGTDLTDVLTFGGDVGLLEGVAPNYVATENLAGTRFVLNQLVFNATDIGPTGLDQTLGVDPLALGLRFLANGATGPQITQNGAGGITLNVPLALGAQLTLTGSGTGEVTMNYAVTGAEDIVKNGTSTFRFGTPYNSLTIPTTGPSANSWMGKLTINDGTIRFNNNADSGRTALRANPVVLGSATAQLTANSEIRTGTLSGNAGTVQTINTNPFGNQSSASIVIHALSDGTYGGTLRIDASSGTGANDGELVVRGAGKQTLSGNLLLGYDGGATRGADLTVGRGATLVFSGGATLGTDTRGSVVLAGGTFQLDNVATNNTNRLRDATSASTGLDTTGGGTFQLIGNTAGTTETVGRLQLSGNSAASVRSGAVAVGVVQNTGAVALTFQSYNRVGTANPFTTIDFQASGGTLGASAGSPRILFNTAPVTFNGLFGNTEIGAPASSVGWATVNGVHFATYGANGVAAVAPTAFNQAVSNAAANSQILGSATISLAGTFSQNSIEIAPIAAGQSLSIAGAGNLDTNGILLAGATDYTIANSGVGSGGLAGTNTRYVHVAEAALTLGLNLGAANFPLVKSGAGTLALTHTLNSSATFTLALNAGALRANPASTLPGGELQFRGGVLEIVGGSFTRSVGTGFGNVNWRTVGEDQGSGGFAASGTDATVTLSGSSSTLYSWEDAGFLNSGHALTFGSTKADKNVTFTNPVSLSAAAGTVNYNAREIRTVRNPSAPNAKATMSGVISGTLQNDLLKTGDGTLEVTGANTYSGATIVRSGTLRVKNGGSIASSVLTDVRPGATLGGNAEIGAVQIAAAAVLDPGAEIGLTSVLATKDLKFLGGSALVFQIGGVTAGGDGTTGYDQLNVTGTLTLNGGDLQGTLLNGFNPTLGTLFFILKNDASDLVNGTFAQGFSITISGQPFDISYTGDVATNSFSTPGGNDVVVRAAAPEPTSALLGASGLLLLALRRTRVTRKSQSAA